MPHLKITRPHRRTAALLCAALAGLGFAGLSRVQAAPTGPILATSPPTPVPFQSPVYHSGGGPTPYPLTNPPAIGLTPLIDPLQGQLQGTPTELYNGNITQIPSYDLGNYDPTRPPTGLQGGVVGGADVYFPDHFADGGYYSWAAPFAYVAAGATTVTVDDNAAPPTGAVATSSGFTLLTNGTVVTPNAPGSTAAGFTLVNDPVAFPSAGTATNAEYLRIAPRAANDAATYQAVWTLYQATAGNYSLYFHIPSDLPSAAGTAEVRDTQVAYSLSVRDAGGNVTSTSTATTSQTEANDTQFLAGPFQVAAGGSVVVTLTRALNPSPINNNADYLVADSFTLQATIGDVQSAPTVITHDLYASDFNSAAHPLQYWGIYVPPASTPNGAPTATTTGTVATANANPDTTAASLNPTGSATAINGGNILLHSGNPATSFLQDGATVDPTHLRQIRQLVYFGRSDPSASVSSSVDDSDTTRFTSVAGTPVSNTTASNGEYKIFGTNAGNAPTLAAPATRAAAWNVTVPTAGSGASFFVYVHIPSNLNNETRLSRVYYRVLVNGAAVSVAAISQITQGTDAQVALPTGPIVAPAGAVITVELDNVNATGTTSTPAPVVVADSVTVSTGTGQGAIYCVDGFSGSVVWRYETPGSANGSSAPVFSSPVITKINVVVTPATTTTAAVYANRLVAIVGDNNGLVYCLDAIGNGDGTSNVNVLAKDANGVPIPGDPISIPQPAYGGQYGAVTTAGTPAAPLTSGTVAATAALTAHVGTTGTYWVYRPDASRPKYIAGANIGQVKPIDPTSDLPVPAAFNTASPNVFVDPTISTTPDATNKLASNSIVYIGNSNGVLYALDGLGAPIDTTSTATLQTSGDTFNYSQDSQVGVTPIVPSVQPLWWFSLRGVDPNSGSNASSADIESAPAIYIKATTTGAAPATATYVPTVYIGSAHEIESTSNVGRLYALNGLYGPSGNGGRSSSDPAAAGHGVPGGFNYNVSQRPQINKTDTADWSFPDAVGTDAYSTGKSYGSTGANPSKPRPALGNITGSPVVFTNTDEATAAQQTRIYFAADSGYESTTTTPVPATRPDSNLTGRLWAVSLDGSVGTTTNSTTRIWAYPLANDPNDASKDAVPEPDAPMGAFLRATPAIGFVQFPLTTVNGDGTAYNPADAVNTGGISGRSVPMLYVGTEGVNDTALYAIDIDGDMTPPTPANAPTTAGLDTRTIYRLVSPDGSIFQSSPALIANASSTGGNGGAVYAVAGNTLYDYGATPVSNPFSGQTFPLIRENTAIVGFGPISSPAVAGANTTDLSTAFLATPPGAVGLTNTSAFTTNTTDWVYVGDSSSGYCRGITPNDASYGGIAVGLGSIAPYDPVAPSSVLLNAIMQTFLVKTQTSKSSADALPIGLSAPLQVYEWGESVYIRFTNVAPFNPTVDPNLFIHDTRTYTDLTQASTANPIPFYTNDGTPAETVTFNLSDVDAAASNQQGDNFAVQQRLIATPPDGFVVDANPTAPAAFPPVTTNLVANNNSRYLATYTYPPADGTGRNDTPGARRRLLNVRQLVTIYNYTGGDVTSIGSYTKAGTTYIGGDAANENIVSQKTVDPVTGAVTYGFNANSKIPAVDQPTFGILNPLGVRGGGVNLLAPAGSLAAVTAVPVGDEVGPFRSVLAPPTLSTDANGVTTIPAGGDYFTLEALTNGNDVLTVAPPSSSGVGGNPTRRPEGLTGGGGDPTGVTTPTVPYVVVTTTSEIAHNTTGSNAENVAAPTAPIGVYKSTADDGLNGPAFGGYGLDVFDRSALFNLGQTLRLKMTVPTNVLFAPPSGRDGLYWNSNFDTPGSSNTDTTGHSSVVNFLPWETPPVPYSLSLPNGSQDYPDISPGNIVQTALSEPNGGGFTNAGGDLTSNSVTLTQATAGTAGGNTTAAQNRTMYGDPVQIQVTVPHYQPANQQLYQQPTAQAYTAPAPGGVKTGQQYLVGGQIAPATEAGASQIDARQQTFPMGYVTSKRLYVPNGNGFYSIQRPYRDVRVYTGVPIDMRTSVAETQPTTDIGQAPAAFGIQTEQYTAANNANAVYPLGFFDPYPTPAAAGNAPTPSAFLSYFKPLEIHNDGNVNLLDVHLNQKIQGSNGLGTLTLHSDANDLLSSLGGLDLYGSSITGPENASNQRLASGGGTSPLPGTSVPEQAFLIRSSLDTDLIHAYGRNPYIVNSSQLSLLYPGATFHKATVGGNQPSTLTVPDDPERFVSSVSLPTAPTPQNPVNAQAFKSAPFVSLAFPFGTPVGTYATAAAQDPFALRLFEGIDTTATNGYSADPAKPLNYLYPPQYGASVGGIKAPAVDSNTGEPIDSNQKPEDVFTGFEPASTIGTQLIGTVKEQRLTDGATFGAVPMVDTLPAGKGANNTIISTADFAPAAFRDLTSGNLSVYWTSHRDNTFSIYGANLPFTPGSTPGSGYFLPTNPAGQWWSSIAGYNGGSLKPVLTSPVTATQTTTNSGLSIVTGLNGADYAFDVNTQSGVGVPYQNTLLNYTVNAATGAVSNNPLPVTPPSSNTQVKYGVHGLSTTGSNFTNNLWAFWTASTRGRTALYYNSLGTNGTWIPTAPAASSVGLLPVPAGLTAVADASPMLVMAPVPAASGTTSYIPTIEVTYSGTAPDGNIDLYASRYVPHVPASAQDPEPASQLDLVTFPAVTENLRAVGGWYQARDVAWSRTGVLNLSVPVMVSGQALPQQQSLLYDGTGKPLFTKALYDKASGLLVLTGVKVPVFTIVNGVTQPVTAGATTTNTVYVDAATGRIRFSPVLLPATTTTSGGTTTVTTQTFPQIRGTFSPQARRLTEEPSADTAPVTFIDTAPKANDAAFVLGVPTATITNVETDRRWTIWREAGAAGATSSATLYFKTQRLTFFVPTAIDPTKTITITLGGTTYSGAVDVDYQRGRLYFPIISQAEGQTATVAYTAPGATSQTTTPVDVQNTVQWQDEPLANVNDVPNTDSVSGLDTIIDSDKVPIAPATNENNVAAFLDPYAGVTSSHKVWLFWNSTRNGTADIYSETIDPRFAPGPVTP